LITIYIYTVYIYSNNILLPQKTKQKPRKFTNIQHKLIPNLFWNFKKVVK